MTRKRLLESAAALLSILAFEAILYRKVIRLWWMYDDPFQLRLVRDVALGSLLSTKDFYGGASVFTPLLIVSLKADSLLFGTAAPFFYAHQLASFATALLLEYCLLRLWCSPLPSLSAVVATMTGAPLLQIVPLLMCRHYIEGALFAMAAAIAYVAAVRGRGWPAALLSAIAYFLAACAKEIFLPLPLLLAAIPEGERRDRARFLGGHFVAAAVYGLWRLLAVGFDVGAYGVLGTPDERRRLLLALPWQIIRQLAGSGSPAGWAAVICVGACAAALFIRRPAARWPIVAAFVLSIVVLLPLAAAVERRYAFTLWLCAAAAIAFLPAVVPRFGAALAVAVGLLSLLAFRVDWPVAYRDLLRMSDEARVLAALRPEDILRNPIAPPTTMLELAHLTGTEAHAYYDELHLCDPAMRIGRIFEYDAARREVLETSRAGLDRACASIVEKPMSVEIRFDSERALYWNLGPYREGRWTFVIAEGIVAYDVTAQGGFRRPGWDRFRLRARYIAPEGWRTYSPLIPVDSRNPLEVYRR
jgi:hypothetical protein